LRACLLFAKWPPQRSKVTELPSIKNDPKDETQSGTFREPELVFRFLKALASIPRAFPSAEQAEVIVRTGIRRDEARRASRSWVEMRPDGGEEVPAVLNIPAWAAKGKRARTVGLPAQALHIIVRLAQDLDVSDPVFPRQTRQSRTSSL
jgi:integrase